MNIAFGEFYQRVLAHVEKGEFVAIIPYRGVDGDGDDVIGLAWSSFEFANRRDEKITAATIVSCPPESHGYLSGLGAVKAAVLTHGHFDGS